MSNFTRANPGGYGGNDPIASAEIEKIDNNLSKAVNGDEGGTYAGDLTWSGAHEHDGTVTHNALAIHTADIRLDEKLLLNGSGAGIRYRSATLGDADADITVAADTYYWSAPIQLNRTYTVRHTGAVVPGDGQRIRVTCTISPFGGGEDAIFEREDNTELGRIEFLNNGGWIEFEYDSTKGWFCIGAGGDGSMTVPH